MPARSDPASAEAQDLARLVAEVGRALADSLRFRMVAISLFRPAWDDYVVVSVHGSAGARGALLGRAVPREAWSALLDERFFRRGAYFVPADADVWA
nr:hypothetical protein [Actinomycetota bacterium]